MASSNQPNVRISSRTVISKSIIMDNEGFCSCFICDIMPTDNLKATYSANKIGVKCRNCQTNIVARSCSNLYRTCKSCVEFCECHACISEPQWDKKEIIRSSNMWSSCIICKHARICDSCWKDDRETCGTCVNNIIEEDRDYAEEEEQRVVDLLGEEDSISGNLVSIVAEYNNTAIGSPELDNSLFALEASINGGSGTVAREDAVYNVQLANSNSSSTINTTGDNIRVGTAGGTTVESNTSRVNLAVQKVNAAKDSKKKKMKKKEPTLVSSTSASSTVLVQQESAFSTLTRILDDYRSRLKGDTVEALMLCKAWLEFTRSYEHAPKVQYVFPTKGGGRANITTTEDEADEVF